MRHAIPYIGETGQYFSKREYQHKNDIIVKRTTNGIYDHLKTNKGHKIAWDKAVFLDHESRSLPRKIKESIYINAVNPGEELSRLMNIEKGMKINPCWMMFNTEIRNHIQKKCQIKWRHE